MSHRNLLGLLDNFPRFLDVLVTELGAKLRRSTGRFLVFGSMAEQSPLTGYEHNIVEISSKYARINFFFHEKQFHLRPQRSSHCCGI